MKLNYLQSIGLVALFVVLNACGGSSAEPLNVAGDYDLVSVSGSGAVDDCDAVFPNNVTITQDGKKIELLGDGEKLAGEVDDKGNFSAVGNAFEGGGTVSCSGTIDPEKDAIQASCEVSAGNDKMNCEVSYGPNGGLSSSIDNASPAGNNPAVNNEVPTNDVPTYELLTAGSYKKVSDHYDDVAICEQVIPATVTISKPSQYQIQATLYGVRRTLNYDQNYDDFYFSTISPSTEVWCAINPKMILENGSEKPGIRIECEYNHDDTTQANQDKYVNCRSEKIKL